MKILNRPIPSQLANRSAKKPLTSRSLILGVLGLAIAVTACTSSPTVEQSSADGSPTTETTASTTKTYAKDGVAIGGADPVAYFTEEAYVPGSADYTHEWQGVTWQFSSEENRDLFAENPEQYAPEYGGFCAWAVAAKNSLVPIDPNAWSVVDDKLYLNANQKVQADWTEDIPGFIAKADDNWPALSQ
ncbi:YHS domain family [Synechococcus sp. PCC 7335]|uniref:YHS domain-containing (seleno)protein n=1 Tax=Synechococcus sp. (strain ATCC 29403 / PCC 7335) TaxID=91464 RepID=UPI00017EDD34|nr:YHS domain-containing (seleno)protein [Synechococcus sp. PCC 7335]EDX84997.1 YHS domain family [Synechococcus sp. PCC 7335]